LLPVGSGRSSKARPTATSSCQIPKANTTIIWQMSLKNISLKALRHLLKGQLARWVCFKMLKLGPMH